MVVVAGTAIGGWDFWYRPLFLSPPFLRLHLGTLSWVVGSGRPGLAWRKLGTHWERSAGDPTKGLSETRILWDPSLGLSRDLAPFLPPSHRPRTGRKEEDIRLETS